MGNIPNEAELTNRLREVISKYLNDNVKLPSMETIERDLIAQDRLANLLLSVNNVIKLIRKDGIEFDKDHLSSLPKKEIEKRIDVFINFIDKTETDEAFVSNEALHYLKTDSSNKHLLTYLIRELNWIVISILSASYVSSFILMRAVFELIIGIASKKTGKMSNRIESISSLDHAEKKSIKKLWNHLCAWGHPYGKWVKEVCPIYSSHKPLYHYKLCDISIEELEKIIDLFLVVSFSKYELNISHCVKDLINIGVDVNRLKLLSARVKA